MDWFGRAKVDRALEMEEDVAVPPEVRSRPGLRDWLRGLGLENLEPVLQDIAESPLDVKAGFEAGLLDREMLVAKGFKLLQAARLELEAKKL